MKRVVAVCAICVTTALDAIRAITVNTAEMLDGMTRLAPSSREIFLIWSRLRATP